MMFDEVAIRTSNIPSNIVKHFDKMFDRMFDRFARPLDSKKRIFE